MKTKAPCKNCEDRHKLCHSHCEAYQEYAKEREETRVRLLQEREILGVIKDVQYRVYRKKNWRDK
jgi:hypothetical protein